MITRNIRPERLGMSVPMKEPEPYYPTISLSLKDVPEAKTWQVGETYCVQLELKQTGKYENKGGGSATFEIRKVCLEDEDGSDLDD